MIEVLPVTNKRLLKAFIKTPWPLYRQDPAWIAPLLLERRLAFSPRAPVFRHLRWQPWVAYREGRPVGRICAQIDALHQQRHGEGTGYFGLIEGEDDPELFAALLAAAEGWLRSNGMQQVVGPFNLNINQEVGLLAEGYHKPPSFMMGHARPYYHQHIEAQGYRPCQQMLAYEVQCAYQEPKAIARMRLRLAPRLKLRPLDTRRKAAELELLRNIFNDAWAGNWGFVPFTAKEFKALGEMLLLVIPPELVLLAELDGEEVGFLVLLPNINEAIRDLNGRLLPLGWLKLLWRLKVKGTTTGRAPLMGVRRRLQDTSLGGGVAMSLLYRSRAAGLQQGITSVELSWILEENKGMRNIIERIGGRITKRYFVYERALSRGARGGNPSHEKSPQPGCARGEPLA